MASEKSDLQIRSKAKKAQTFLTPGSIRFSRRMLSRCRTAPSAGWRRIRIFVLRGGHFAGLGLDFVAECGAGLDHAGAGAIRARLAEHALERLLGALAGDADEAELV